MSNEHQKFLSNENGNFLSNKHETFSSNKHETFLSNNHETFLNTSMTSEKMSLRDSNYIPIAIMLSKFGYSLGVIKSTFSEGWSWFKFNKLRLALDIALKLYTSGEKELKLKVRKIAGLVPMFAEVTGKN